MLTYILQLLDKYNEIHKMHGTYYSKILNIIIGVYPSKQEHVAEDIHRAEGLRQQRVVGSLHDYKF
jgi:hypothetical protein